MASPTAERPRRTARGLFLLIAFLLIAVTGSVMLVTRVARAEVKAADDVSTPRRYVAAFLGAANAGDWGKAGALIGTSSSTAAAARNPQAIERAHELAYLLERRSWIRLEAISDEPSGSPEDGELVERVGIVRFDDGQFPILLERTPATPPRWAFSSETLASLPAVYAQRGPSFIETSVPDSLRGNAAGLETWQWIGLPLAIVLAIAGSRLATYLLRGFGRLVARRTKAKWDDELVERAYGPLRLLFACVLYAVLAYMLGLPATLRTVGFHVLLTLGIASMVWLALRSVEVLANSLERVALSGAPNATAVMRARGARTRVTVLRRVASVALTTIGVALVLTQFEVVRSVGVSLLASAGVAGVVIGLAAQRTIGSLLAGLQLSVTQPVRIGDTVVIEGEYGVIEEITLTYAVLKVWDERRLVLPITRFLEQPFQNLTRVSSGQHGTVMLYARWTLPMAALRAELDRLLASDPKWDGRTKAVHVTDAKEQSIEVRILVSAGDPGDIFELRANLREHLVTWLQALDDGRHMPRLRIDTSSSGVIRHGPGSAEDARNDAEGAPR